jgi:hypothetical protein
MKKSSNSFRGLPKILRINHIDPENLKISVLFNNGDNRVLDFKRIFNEDWKIQSTDIEYPLMKPQEFQKALKTLSKIVEASLGKRLVISIE